ncbi:serine/arginine repetitive matrix protein 1-like [Dermacentor albipictus]|uniref:serine/arginine repetitive matrix protein 1-like n=1 Tax=Dermacentor albipictus TaxID=60249 RepID=UPI0038FD0F46
MDEKPAKKGAAPPKTRTRTTKRQPPAADDGGSPSQEAPSAKRARGRTAKEQPSSNERTRSAKSVTARPIATTASRKTRKAAEAPTPGADANVPSTRKKPKTHRSSCQEKEEPRQIHELVAQPPRWPQAQGRPSRRVHHHLAEQPRNKEGPQEEPPPPFPEEHLCCEYQERRETAPPRPWYTFVVKPRKKAGQLEDVGQQLLVEVSSGQGDWWQGYQKGQAQADDSDRLVGSEGGRRPEDRAWTTMDEKPAKKGATPPRTRARTTKRQPPAADDGGSPSQEAPSAKRARGRTAKEQPSSNERTRSAKSKDEKGCRGADTRRRCECPVHQKETQDAQGEPEDALEERLSERCSHCCGRGSEASAPLAQSLPWRQQSSCQEKEEPREIHELVAQPPRWPQAQGRPSRRVHHHLAEQPRNKEGPQEEPPPPFPEQHLCCEYQERRETAPPRPWYTFVVKARKKAGQLEDVGQQLLVEVSSGQGDWWQGYQKGSGVSGCCQLSLPASSPQVDQAGIRRRSIDVYPADGCSFIERALYAVNK